MLLLSLICNQIENLLLKKALVGDKPAALLSKFNTHHQEVALLLMRKDSKPIEEKTISEVLNSPEDYTLLLTLNRSPQFFEPLGAPKNSNHPYLFDPLTTLLPEVKTVLILGDGDGLQTREAIQYSSIKKITVVDIDEQWARFAKTNPFLKKHNHNALEDHRVTVHFVNTFKWIASTQETFDLIVIDFPVEPGSLTMKRAYSIQFFRDLKRLLNKSGVAVFHTNNTSNPTWLQIYSKTAQESGFVPLFGYKQGTSTWSPIEQTILFHDEGQLNSFIDQYVNSYLKNPDKIKILEELGYIHYGKVESSDRYLSLYNPFTFKAFFKKNLELLKETIFGKK